MRDCKKNQQELYYATYSDQITEYYRDSDGNIIYDEIDGELIPRIKCERAGYNNPVHFDFETSAGKGTAQTEVFGSDVDFTRTISTTDMSIPIDELSLVWIEHEPEFLNDGTVDPDSADYKVAAKPSKSKTDIVIALKALPKGG